jgi:hypothetical protein
VVQYHSANIEEYDGSSWTELLTLGTARMIGAAEQHRTAAALASGGY